MLKLIIEDDEGRKTVVPFVRDEITVGRQEGNTIRLTERNVSRRHARLVRSNGHVLVEDLGSYNGIRVNGEKIQGKYQVHDGDLIQIGDYDLAIQSDQPQAAPPPAPATASGEHPVNGANGHVESVTEADVQAVGDEEDNEPTAPTPGESEAARRQSTAIIRVDQIEGNRARQVVDIEAEEAPRLVVVNTEFAGREFACIRSELKIGRTDDNDISIDHRSLSRTHAKVVREDGGEWKVIDMQSANGTAVNGETYAQSSLRNGDVITLGHVKLKFVGPGESFRYVPGTDYEKAQKAGAKEAAGGGKSKMPLIVGGGVAAVAIAALAIFMLTRKPEIPVEPQPKVVIAEPPVKVPEEKKPPVEEKKPDEQVAQKTPDETKKNVEPEPKIAKIDEKLAGAKTAIDAREFDKAQDILQSITNPDGSRPKQVEDMLDEVNAEILFKKNISAAEKALSGNNLEEAQRLTEESEGTVAYTAELNKLKAKLQKAQDAAAKLAAKANTPPPDETKKVVKANDAQNNNKTVKANPTQEAQKLFDEGYTVLQSKQYNEAASIFRHCLELDANFAKCHLYLGVSYAKLKQVDKGAYHYKQFVKLAPNDEQTPKVRKLLEQYEQNKKGTP